MSEDRIDEPENELASIDPPGGIGGGGASRDSTEGTSESAAKAIDPPGGTGGSKAE